MASNIYARFGVSCALVLLIVGCARPPTESGLTGFTIYFIDVGQGDATLIVAGTGETLLIDAGRSKTRIRDRLAAIGVTDLDAIAMTHPDADHIAGLVEVLALYPIEHVYLNGGTSGTNTFANVMAAVTAEGAEVVTVTRGDTIAIGDLTISVLHPGPLTGDSNEDSMVLLLDCGEVEVLLTGDAEVGSEQAMIQAGVLVDIDVLKVGHHGSRSSTSGPFLDVAKPEVGVISAGLNSQYGHPHVEVVNRLTDRGVQLWRTDTTEGDDTVRLESDCQTFTMTFGSGSASSVPILLPTPTLDPVAPPTLTLTHDDSRSFGPDSGVKSSSDLTRP